MKIVTIYSLIVSPTKATYDKLSDALLNLAA